MKKTPEIIWLTPDHEDKDYIIWQSDQPADSDNGVEYIRADLVDRQPKPGKLPPCMTVVKDYFKA